MEFIARDRGIFQLAELPDLGDDIAYLVMLFDCRENGFIGGIRAVGIAELIENVQTELFFIVLQSVILGHERGIDMAHKEFIVHIFHEVQHLEMLL